jgi:hypothetical protein
MHSFIYYLATVPQKISQTKRQPKNNTNQPAARPDITEKPEKPELENIAIDKIESENKKADEPQDEELPDIDTERYHTHMSHKNISILTFKFGLDCK